MRFEIVQGDEQLSSHSGLALVGVILDRTSIRKRLDAVMLPEHSFPEISHGEVATAMIGLICVGKPDFDAIEAFRDDPFFIEISAGYPLACWREESGQFPSDEQRGICLN